MAGDNSKIPSILGLCNPLLDISAYVDEEILKKYKLEANNVILAGEEHKDLCRELVAKYPVEYTAGGSAQNVMRVAAGILRRQNFNSRILFTGCIGKDEFGKLMEKKAQDDGVITHYSISDSKPTGTCAVCLTANGKNRSLCAFLGASQEFTDQHLRDNWEALVANTDIIYMSGFLIAVSPATYHLLGEHIAKHPDSNRRFCLNLSAPYVSAVFGGEIEKVMKYVDILFGNDDEAIAYAKHKKWPDSSVEEIACRISAETKLKPEIPRLVIITQGERPIILARQENGQAKVQQFPCKPIPRSEMVDTNGAGDSFAGGFLSQFLRGESLAFCIKMGDYAAREIIKMSGIALPSFENIPTPGS